MAGPDQHYWQIAGERTLTRQTADPASPPWIGRIDHPAYRQFAWPGASQETVVEAMNKALGPIPDSAYVSYE